MTIHEAIQHAIDGGYRHEEINSAFILWNGYENILPFVNGYGWVQFRDKNNQPPELCPAYVPKCRIEQILLDPEFWQALGKSKGWGLKLKYNVCDCHVGEYYFYKFCPKCGKELKLASKTSKEWKEKWHKFIDHLANGGTIEDFFSKI